MCRDLNNAHVKASLSSAFWEVGTTLVAWSRCSNVLNTSSCGGNGVLVKILPSQHRILIIIICIGFSSKKIIDVKNICRRHGKKSPWR